MYTKTVLNNGLTVASYRMPKRVSISVGIWVKAGSRYESKGINGISHFLEHLLFKGTKTRSCDEIKQAIEGVGGTLNAFTAEEMTCYLFKVPAQHFSGCLEVLADMVLNANLAAEDVETERKVILEEISMYKDLPGHLAMEFLIKLLWPNQPLGRNIAGETATVKRLTREKLLSYQRSYYQPGNIVVVACGNLSHKQLLEKCRRYFRGLGKGKTQRFIAVKPRLNSPQIRIKAKDIEQTHLALGLHGLSRRNPQRFTLALLHIILGANMSSRLFREVREERGLAYEIGTAVKFYQDCGAFIVHAGVDNRRLTEALEVILKQLSNIKQVRVEEDELRRAKDYYIGQLLLALEDTADHMFWLGEQFVSLDKLLSPNELVRRINSITAGDLQNLAKKIFQNQNLNLAVIGPVKDKIQKEIRERLAV